ncbi:MAG TPA: helix-turn-helix transcriptional regulator [Stellaceae bacterium]|nr:helix-turn-helix transcriptional regulator [Stellaceae bacterium]
MKHADHRSTTKVTTRRKRRNEHDLYAGERLRIARKLVGMSQQQLADHLGVSFQAVQKYENGENRLSAGRLIRATQILGVTLAFFARDESGGAAEKSQPDRFSAHELDLIRAYRALPDEALRTQLRQLVLTMARGAGAGGER